MFAHDHSTADITLAKSPVIHRMLNPDIALELRTLSATVLAERQSSRSLQILLVFHARILSPIATRAAARLSAVDISASKFVMLENARHACERCRSAVDVDEQLQQVSVIRASLSHHNVCVFVESL